MIFLTALLSLAGQVGAARLWIKGRGHVGFDCAGGFDPASVLQRETELTAFPSFRAALPKQFNGCHGFVSKPA
ncbi:MULTISPECIES: hypothetical protein [unclassified Rhizobium]|uniref:hypothetical protein n=1 Tax=unclassified Rhizobium TaxID=2613769 RepID=UPI001C8339C9|nr:MULTISPECIES: hypothetical protein [unclassified Rhizobium]MBX5163246.1 hypothetical protein [Rhizobium sp. NZLR4b]MBX5168739.1 hypothetical protein [Rhizobium sp. NZLR1b]MBX5183837.1 hypothetical protein [Rhizobium sp. NZLR5]MBX5188713.1 hypothetical protein [Rhizobium sp. NZLR3b]MBX5195656.1 hypothetical protein [Rhizobium sp. NZLR10]